MEGHRKYPKIPGPYKREGKNILWGQWSSDELKTLQNCNWKWYEKVDGTNIRICWDGYDVTIGGRTDRADIPDPIIEYLIDRLGVNLGEEIFEQNFGEIPAVIFGEGVGPTIQKPSYFGDYGFIGFDVAVGDNGWLPTQEAEEMIREQFDLDFAPFYGYDGLFNAIEMARLGIQSKIGLGLAEGIVGRPYPADTMRDRYGKRIICKVKTKDFYGKGVDNG